MRTTLYSFAAATLLHIASAQPAELSHAHQHVHAARGVTQKKTGHGVVYSPYNTDHSCKSTEQVMTDISTLDAYDTVRIYGVDCNQVSNVVAACKATGKNIYAGIYDVGSTAEELQTLIKGVGNNWGMIDSISIGNEVVNSQGAGMIGSVLAGIQTARDTLKSTPFKGDIVTVDTFNALIAHPELCQHSDYAAANAHAFFDPTAVAQGAGPWVKKTIEQVSAACGGKRVVITESGWPSQGGCNGSACPSSQNQMDAVNSIKSTIPIDIYLFTAYNDLWKSDTEATHGCEKYWGILGTSTA